ncbi:uncharacterized protein LOC114307786 [Camellia sinensis]|uniref:uncharacterized protein LOC114307786 n=1 Tax=Camellia sinensis TaxID=4442 RepID=UPI0010356DAB|nr:uncharacterized protein LOC114307786 [Camellia sinensis]
MDSHPFTTLLTHGINTTAFQSPMYESNECYVAGYTQQTFHGHGGESSSRGGYETEFHNNIEDVPTYSYHTTQVEVAGNMAETVNSVQFADSDINFNTKFKNKELKQLLWKAGSAHQRRKYNGYLQQIQAIDQEAINWVYKMNPEEWALSYDGGHRWGVLTSNDAECFNSVLKGARNLPISAMVEFTFRRLVKYFDEMGAQAEIDVRNEFQYPRDMQKTIEDGIARANTFRLISYDRPRRVFEVQTFFRHGRGRNTQIVRMNQPTCSCGKYEIRHYPCSHMLAVMSECGDNPFEYVDLVYRLPVYMRVWETKFNPIPHQDY